MMMIDYKNYLDMDSKDLKNLVAHANNILNLRQRDEMAAMKAFDKDALLKTFEQNETRELSDEAWKALNLCNLTLDKIDFFEMLRTLPQYEKKNKAQTLESFEETITNKAFESVDYLNYILDKNEYQSSITKKIQTGKHLKYLNLKEEKIKIVEVLIEKEIIAKPNSEILSQIKELGEPKAFFGYLEYAITEHHVTLPQLEAQEFFKKYWGQVSSRLINLLHQQYCTDLHISMDEAVKSYSDTAYPEETKMYKNFVRTSRERFAEGLSLFEVTPETVLKMLVPLRTMIMNTQNDNDPDYQIAKENLTELCGYVSVHLPQARTMMETYVQDKHFPRFKEVASRLMLYIQLNQDIPASSSEIENDENSAEKMRSAKI